MKRKKLAIIATTALTAIAICAGSTFAWFTARDDVMNKFTTGKAIDPDNPDNINYGVKIEENWKPEDGKDIVPGVEVNKDVKARNKASYKSFIRLKFEPKFTSCKEGVDLSSLDPEKLDLKMTNLTTKDELKEEEWVLGDDGYYYFLKVVDPEEDTKYLLDSVTLKKTGNAQYGSASFDVDVHAESVQASNGGASYEWKDAGEIITNKLSDIAKSAGLE